MTPQIAAIHLALVAVPVFVALWTDLSAMRIPNAISLAMLAIFVVAAPLTLPLADIPWRLATAGIVFAICLLLYILRQMGAGDVKFAGAIFLFVEPADVTFFIRILAIMALAGVITHRLFARIPAARAMAPHWTSWTAEGVFSYGVALSLALVYYLLLVALGG